MPSIENIQVLQLVVDRRFQDNIGRDKYIRFILSVSLAAANYGNLQTAKNCIASIETYLINKNHENLIKMEELANIAREDRGRYLWEDLVNDSAFFAYRAATEKLLSSVARNVEFGTQRLFNNVDWYGIDKYIDRAFKDILFN